MGIGVVERAAVVGAENEKAHHFGIVFFQHLADGEKIAQRFGHFFVVHADKAVVQPWINGKIQRALLTRKTKKEYSE